MLNEMKSDNSVEEVDNSKIIISLTDILDQRIRKEQEIEYYEDELKKIESKLFFLRKEKELTELSKYYKN